MDIEIKNQGRKHEDEKLLRPQKTSAENYFSHLEEATAQFNRVLTLFDESNNSGEQLTPEQEKAKDRIQRTLRIVAMYAVGFNDYLRQKENNTQNKQLNILLRIILFFLSFLSYRRTSSVKPIEIDFIEIEKQITGVISDVRTLRHLYGEQYREIVPGIRKNSALGRQIKSTDEPIVIGTERHENSITLDYQKGKWGVKRVMLDGIQNHLPADAKGTCTIVQFYDQRRKEWIELGTAAAEHLKDEDIGKIRFIDNGLGFDKKLLLYLKSTKDQRSGAAGKFGEGLKMIAAAALRNDLDIEFESKNWRARPFTKEVEYEDPERGKQSMETLCFEIDTLQRDEPFIGSRTTFHKPSGQLIARVREINKDVLYFRNDYKPLSTSPVGEIVAVNRSDLYLKGIMIASNSPYTIFSYNFFGAETNRDRDKLEKDEIKQQIEVMLEHTQSRTVIEAYYRGLVSKQHSSCIESSFHLKPFYRNLWREIFYEIYGTRLVIAGNYDKGTDFLTKRGYKVIEVGNWLVYLTLKSIGIPCVNDLVGESGFRDEISASITLESTEARWNYQRILLDTVQNHLPEDSGGSYAEVLVMPLGSTEFIPYQAAKGLNYRDVDSITFSDNGNGFEYERLGLIHSSKTSKEDAAGQFGEGLKMAAAAALRMKMQVTYRSRHWTAEAKSRATKLDGETVHELVFNLTESATTTVRGSRTTFTRITRGFWEEVQNLEKKVLYFDPNRAAIVTGRNKACALADNGNKAIYNKGIYITEEYSSALLFAYNFHTDDIPRDRDTIHPKVITREINLILSAANNAAFISKVLKAAEGKTDYFEFQFFQPEYPNAWKEAFFTLFGEKAVIVDTSNMDLVLTTMLRGYKPIVLKGEIGQTLKTHCGIATVTEVNRAWYSNITIISEEDLTPDEREVFDFRKAIDPHLEGNSAVVVKVFTAKDDSTGGFWDRSERTIYINRVTLRDVVEFTNTYIHEKAHQITGATDETREHFDYVCRHYAKILISVIKHKTPVTKEDQQPVT